MTIALVAMESWASMQTGVAMLAFVLGTASLLHACCPRLAQVVLHILGAPFPELPVLSFWRFLAWCTGTVAILSVVNKVPVLLPD